jgi:serine/threonine protein kinase/CHASE1-domain containing sensor protein
MQGLPQERRLWLGERTARPGLRAWAPIALVLIISLAVAVTAFWLLRSQQIALHRALLEARVTSVAARLHDQLETPLESARSLGSLFAASDTVTRDEFRRFVLPALSRERQVYAFEWSPRVTAAERLGFEAAARADGLDGYEIREPGPGGGMDRAGARAVYVPLLFVEPHNPATGYDLGSRDDRREILDAACRTASPAATGGLQLVEDPPGMTAMVAFVPVWRQGVVPATAAQRCQEVLGYVGMVFRFHSLLHQVIEQAGAHDLDMVLRDAAPGGIILHATGPGAAAAVAESPWRGRREVHFADRTWTLDVAPRSSPSIWLPYMVLLFGVFGALLAAAQAGGVHQIRELRRQVREARPFGQYFLEEEIGRGGMGVVYRARHVLMHRATAIKLLSPEASTPKLIGRFEREVQLTCQLTHPNTIAIYDYGRTSEGQFYYVMEYVDGITFDQLVQHDGCQPLARALHLIRQVAAALREAHGMDIIHRDLNPSNLMLTVRGGVPDVVKVLDFGLVKKMAPGEIALPSLESATLSAAAVSGATHLASTVRTVAERPAGRGLDSANTVEQGLFIGTAGYASPEVIVGGVTDARSDLYGLGAVWFLLVTGQPAFAELGSAAIFTAQMRDEPPRPSNVVPSIPAVIDDLIARCLSRDPGRRPQSIDEIVAVLDSPDLPSWSRAAAEAWWRDRAPSVRIQVAHSASVPETSEIIDVSVPPPPRAVDPAPSAASSGSSAAATQH